MEFDRNNSQIVKESTRGRIEFVDLAKGFCIILVVVIHIFVFYQVPWPSGINKFFRILCIPSFFFLSGCFFKTYGGGVNFIKKKTNQLLIPFVFWYIILSVALSIFLYKSYGVVLEKAVNFEIIPALTEFITRENFPNSPIWFLLCLFEMNVLFYFCLLIADYWKSHQYMVLIGLAIIIGYIGLFLSLLKINLPMFIDSSMTLLPFFACGYFMNKNINLLQPNKSDKYTGLIIILSFVLVYFLPVGAGFKTNHFGTISFLTLYPCGFLGTMGVIYCAKYFKTLPLISYWGRYSIMILVTHRMVYQLYHPILMYFMGGANVWLIVFVNLLCTMLSYQLLIPLMKKILPYVTAQKDLIK